MNNNSHNNAAQNDNENKLESLDKNESQETFLAKYYAQVLRDTIVENGKVNMISNVKTINAKDIVTKAMREKVPLEILEQQFTSAERMQIITKAENAGYEAYSQLFAIMIVAAWLVIASMYFQSIICVIVVIVCALLSMAYVCMKVRPYWRLADMVIK